MLSSTVGAVVHGEGEEKAMSVRRIDSGSHFGGADGRLFIRMLRDLSPKMPFWRMSVRALVFAVSELSGNFSQRVKILMRMGCYLLVAHLKRLYRLEVELPLQSKQLYP